MATAVDTIWRASTPESVEADLAALWAEAGQAGPLSRALMSNLVVVSPLRSFPTVEEVARKHPARTILLSCARDDDAGGPEAIRVGLHTFGEGDARYGLEFIAVHTTCTDEALPSIVRRLTIGSVPTSVWWTADLSEPAPPEALSTIGRQFLYNSALWRDVPTGLRVAASLLRHPRSPDLADLNWRRLAPVRDAIVHALKDADQNNAPRVMSIGISHPPHERAGASLLAGWLRARLGVMPVVNERGASDTLAIVLNVEGTEISATLAGEHVRVQSGRPSFVMPLPVETEAGAVAAELISLAPDAGLCDALRVLTS
jgi:glucose-6-phosphate dehydrogenase assembly protein OpcA